MISQDVKNALLQSIDHLVARIMAQAGMKENEVAQLITALFADAIEAIDPAIDDKIISPKTAALVASGILNANIGSAPDNLNSIEKIGNYIPQLAQSLADQLNQLATALREDIAEAAAATGELSALLAKHGILGALNLRVPSPAVDAIVSNTRADLLALAVGPYTGFVKASQIGLPNLAGMCGGLRYDEEVLLKIEHMRFDGVTYQTRTAYTSRGVYTTNWNSHMVDTHSLWTGWQRPPEEQLLLTRHDNIADINDTAQYDFISQLEMASLPLDLSGPYLEWLGMYSVHTDWMIGRHATNGLIFWVTSKDADKGRPAEWYILSNAVHSAGYSGDTRVEWEARGAIVVASGTWLDFGAPNTDPANITWRVETLAGQGMFYRHTMPHGKPLGPNPSNYNGVVMNTDFSVSIRDPFAYGASGVYKHELVMRITCADTGTGRRHSRLLRLVKTLDSRIPQLPELGTTVGTALISHDLSVSGANDLIKANPKLQLGARVVKEIGRISPQVGVLPKVDSLDPTMKSFSFPERCVSNVELGVTLIPDYKSPVHKFSALFTVGVELTYGGVTRVFEFIDDYRLSERVNGVLTGTEFDGVTYLVNEEGIQWISIACGKTTDAPVSMLETLFPGASNYVPATDASGGTSWFAHTGALAIKLTATPKDPLNVEDHLELSTAVYLTV